MVPKLDCEVSEKGIAGLRREYQTLIDAGVGDTHEWLDSEDKILAKVPLLPRENIKVRNAVQAIFWHFEYHAVLDC